MLGWSNVIDFPPSSVCSDIFKWSGRMRVFPKQGKSPQHQIVPLDKNLFNRIKTRCLLLQKLFSCGRNINFNTFNLGWVLNMMETVALWSSSLFGTRTISTNSTHWLPINVFRFWMWESTASVNNFLILEHLSMLNSFRKEKPLVGSTGSLLLMLKRRKIVTRWTKDVHDSTTDLNNTSPKINCLPQGLKLA